MAQVRKKKSAAGKFLSVLFGSGKNLQEMAPKFVKVLSAVGTALLVVGGLTSLPYYIPTFYYYMTGWIGINGLNEAATAFATVFAFFLIELSSNVTTHFSFEMVAALLKIGAAPTNSNWGATQWLKKTFPGWIGLLSFVWGFIQLRATHILAAGALIFGLGTPMCSFYFSWSGNTLAVSQMTEKEKPKEHKGFAILSLDSVKTAKVEELRDKYDKKVNTAKGKDAENLKALKKKASKEAWKSINVSVLSGCTWGSSCYKLAVNKAQADSVVSVSAFIPTAPPIEVERDSMLAETMAAFKGAKKGTEEDYDSDKNRFAQIQFGVLLISKYLGAACSILFLVSVLLVTMLKYVDISAISEAAQSLSTDFTTDFTTGSTNEPQEGDSLPQTEAKLRKKIATNFSNAKQGTHKEKTCALNILNAYKELYGLKYNFLKTSNHPNPEAASNAYLQGVIDTFEFGGHPAATDFLEDVVKGIKTFSEYED